MGRDDIRIESNGDRAFTAHLADHWVALEGLHGGHVAAVMVEAVERVLRREGIDASTTLRAATFGYLGTNQVGKSTIELDILRRGRSMITTHCPG